MRSFFAKFKQNQSGQSLIELLFAIGVFALFAIGIAGLTYEGLIGSEQSDERTQAVFHAHEGVDATRSIRDLEWKSLVNGAHGLDDTLGYWEFSGVSEVIDTVYTRTITVSDVERDGSGDIVLGGGTVDPRTKLVRSEVTYTPDFGIPHTVAVEAYVSDWAVFDWFETSDTEFSLGTDSDTEVVGTGVLAGVQLLDGAGGGGGVDPVWVFGGGPFFLDTSDTDFGAGTLSDTQVTDTGDDALVELNAIPSWLEFNFPFGVADMNYTDGTWAVGDNGTIFQFTGAIWAAVPSPVSDDLFGVDTVSGTEAYAVGDNGTLLRYDGAAWFDLTSPTGNQMNFVKMDSGTFGIAVGDNGTILHWNGVSWQSQTSSTSKDLNGVDLLSTTDAWAVGKNSEIVRWDGVSWTNYAAPLNAELLSISMVATDDIHAVGGSGATIKWDGVAWFEVFSPTPSEPIYGVSMVNSTHGFAAGESGRIMHWDGVEWSDHITPTGNRLNSVAMITASDGWIVGVNGNLLRYNGSAWVPYEQASSADYTAVDLFSSTLGFSVGLGGEIVRWDGSVWGPMTSPTGDDLYGVSMISATDGFAVGEGKRIVRWDGNDWTTFTSPGGPPRTFRDVSMVNSSDGFIVDDTGRIYRWNGSAWNSESSPTGDDLFSVDMLSSTDGFAVGENGEIIRWNGTLWNTVASPTGADLLSVSMVSASEGYAVGVGGVIITWDGATWSTMTSPTGSTLNSVYLLSGTDGYAAGVGGVLLDWDGVSWSTMTSPTSTQLNALFMVAGTDGWGMGDNGIIIKLGGYYAPSGTFHSRIFDSFSGTTSWDSLNWAERNFASTDVTVATRSGNTAVPDGSWSAWSAELSDPYSSSISSPDAQYLQYRLTFSTSNTQVSAAMKEIRVLYNNPGIVSDVNGVSMVSETNGFVVGDSGEILQYDGTVWNILSSPTGSDLFEVDMISATDGWGVGANGAMVSWNGSSWSDGSGATAQTLYGVHFDSASNGWAVGNNGTILQWDGATWGSVASPTAVVLRSVHSLSASSAWAVGDSGTILEWDGVSWASVTSPVGQSLNDIHMFSGSLGWAAGDDGKIIVYDGVSWTEDTDAGTVDLHGIWANAADEAWAAGQLGRIVIWDGVSWTIDVLPTLEQFQDIEMTSATDGWAIGLNGTFAHWTDAAGGGTPPVPGQYVDDTQGEFDTGVYSSTQWNTDHVELTLASTSGTYTSEVFDNTDTATSWDQIAWVEDLTASGLKMEAGSTATGSSYTTVNLQQTYTNPVVIPFYHESANTGSVSPRITNVTPTSFDIALTGPNAATPGSFIDDTDTNFNAGTYSSTEISGSGAPSEVILTSSIAWAAHADSGSTTTFDYNDISAISSTDIWAVTDNLKAIHYDGSSWTEHSDLGTQNFYAVEAVASNNVWATGDSGQFYHYNGTTWTETHDISNRDVNGIDALNASDIWATGDSGELYHYNGSTWTEIDDMGKEDIYDVTVLGASSAWAVGESSKIYEYDGSWSQFVDLGGDIIYVIESVSASDIWAAGSSGKIYHYNGSTWSEFVDLGGETIRGLSVVSASDIWASATGGKIYHYNGTTWSEHTDTGGQQFNGMTFLSASEGWAVGNGGVIYEYGASYSSSGTFESQVFDSTDNSSTWDTVSWVEDITATGTNVVIDTRTGNTAIPDGSWSAFAGAHTNPAGETITSPAGRYMQYRVSFSTSDTSGTPRLETVTVVYTLPGTVISSDTVHYFVVEEGNWTMPDGTLIEAATFDSSKVSAKGNSWNDYDIVNFTQPFTSNPAVFHATQTTNDPAWIATYVSRGDSRTNPPTVANGMRISLNGAEVTTTHGSESIGWVAIDQGAGTIDGTSFEVATTSDSVRGHTNGCYNFNFSNSYGAAPIALATQLEMDGGDGGWEVGCNLTASQIGMHSEEDTFGDSERAHTTEIFGFMAFETAFDYAEVVDLTFQVRSCDDGLCAGESFIGPDGAGGTVYTTSTGQVLNVIDNRYFQYQATFTSSAGNTTPELSSVTIDYTTPGTTGGGGGGGGGTGYPTSGTFLSQIHNSDNVATEWDTVYWSETLPASTDATVAVRTGDTGSPDGSWSSWTTEFSDTAGNIVGLTGQYAQYRLTLTSSDDTQTPLVEDITITYNP
jgi:hypothetical protein